MSMSTMDSKQLAQGLLAELDGSGIAQESRVNKNIVALVAEDRLD